MEEKVLKTFKYLNLSAANYFTQNKMVLHLKSLGEHLKLTNDLIK